jgi:hypothetical protein
LKRFRVRQFWSCGKVIGKPRTYVFFGFMGGDRLKFSDVLVAVATINMVFVLIVYPLDLAFVSAFGLTNGYYLSGIVCGLVSALVVGIVFAGKIQESRKEAIAKITVVWGLFLNLLAAIGAFSPTNATYATQSYNGQYGTLSAFQWTLWHAMYADMIAFELVAVIALTTIVGLYIGSMLRKPKNT